MSMYKFQDGDILYNRIKTYPNQSFFFYAQHIYYNMQSEVTGVYTNNVTHVNTGKINLYELNVDRPPAEFIYPFVVKQGILVI